MGDKERDYERRGRSDYRSGRGSGYTSKSEDLFASRGEKQRYRDSYERGFIRESNLSRAERYRDRERAHSRSYSAEPLNAFQKILMVIFLSGAALVGLVIISIIIQVNTWFDKSVNEAWKVTHPDIVAANGAPTQETQAPASVDPATNDAPQAEDVSTNNAGNVETADAGQTAPPDANSTSSPDDVIVPPVPSTIRLVAPPQMPNVPLESQVWSKPIALPAGIVFQVSSLDAGTYGRAQCRFVASRQWGACPPPGADDPANQVDQLRVLSTLDAPLDVSVTISPRN